MFRYILIGSVFKPFKNSGEFLASVDPEYFDDLSACKAIFLKVDGLEVPFFLQQIELDKETSYLKVEEFNAPEDVKPFNGSGIFLREIDINKGNKNIRKPSLDPALVSFTLIDKLSGRDYVIKKIEEYPKQLMATVVAGDEVKLVPLVEDWILEINPKEKTILMDLPDGLL